jgi:hypothetical protein
VNPSEALAAEIEEALREIERELQQPVEPFERVAIRLALERFADRVPREEEFRPW